MMFGKKLQKVSEDERRLPLHKYPQLRTFQECIGDHVQLSGVIPGMVALTVDAKMPGLGHLLLDYGKGLAQMLQIL